MYLSIEIIIILGSFIDESIWYISHLTKIYQNFFISWTL